MPGRKSAYPSRRAILRAAGLAVVAPALGPKQAIAAGYPERPIKIIVPFAPADIMARIVATHLIKPV
ncbi:MAG: Tripartite-type tricarboxylate transporter, receptor component TctC [Bradyrhizobium sp.]|jgi:tripartite-type tricarboxylate transporter receptor subunit TctC|nr:Tripartite-type tricarboxylate transporter, receptor component TctC [Bradyrhizobium sp.]